METITLSSVVKRIGINENTLRAWERRYKAITPMRDENGRRAYSSQEVERIKLLWALVKEGYAIGKIANLPLSKLKKELAATLSPEVNALELPASKSEEYQQSMLKALEKFDLEQLNLILKKARFEISTKDIVMKLIWPLLKKVGQSVTLGNLSITQEHILSALLRDHLGMIHQSMASYDSPSKKRNRCVIITSREGDLHEFGILMASILAHIYQFRTIYLGPNMPEKDLLNACEQINPDLLILGMTSLPADREIVSPQDYVKALHKTLPRKVSIFLGGSGAGIKIGKSERKIIEMKDLIDLDRLLAEDRQN